jgi:NAD(P)H-dependent FMN reductase
MPTKPFRLVVIVGSVREGRLGPTVTRWFARQAEQREDLNVDVIDLAEIHLPMVLPRIGSEPAPDAVRAMADLTPRLAAADAFVVVTPEYNHSFPAALKNAIDSHNQEWHAKPVGFVSYGGMSGGLRAVEQLRPVFAELHAVTVRDTVSFHGARSQFDDEGNPINPAGSNAAAKGLLDQLTWWAWALREARTARPYSA